MHSCGHGVIAGSVVAAALALADHRDQLAGKLVVFGCPADEIHAAGTVARGGGKALSVEAGLWDEMDVAPLLAPRVHRHRLARLALDAPRARAPRRLARSLGRARAAARAPSRP